MNSLCVWGKRTVLHATNNKVKEDELPSPLEARCNYFIYQAQSRIITIMFTQTFTPNLTVFGRLYYAIKGSLNILSFGLEFVRSSCAKTNKQKAEIAGNQQSHWLERVFDRSLVSWYLTETTCWSHIALLVSVVPSQDRSQGWFVALCQAAPLWLHSRT